MNDYGFYRHTSGHYARFDKDGNCVSMEKECLDICEKTMLFDTSKLWKPDPSLLMHVASYTDHGAHPEVIEESKKIITDNGGTPQKVKITIRIDAEYLD